MKTMSVLFMVALTLLAAPAPADVTYRYSVDLGSDLDLSDPVTTSNNWMDCGNVWKESTPTLWKNDCDNDGEELGIIWPTFAGTAPQPAPSDVANPDNAGKGSPDVREQYGAYWDMDDDDQLGIKIPDNMVSNPRVLLRSSYGHSRAQWTEKGIHYQPGWLAISYDEDRADGWYSSDEIPTKTPAWDCYGTSLWKDEVCEATGTFGKWGTPVGVRTEANLGLSPNPTSTEGDEQYNDDIDALDIEDHEYWYLTPDHEANWGYDPGSVYMVDSPQMTHAVQVLDDVENIGVTLDTDIAGLEFCAIGYDMFYDLFGYHPEDMEEDDDALCLLFTVKNIDYDCMPSGWTRGGDNDPYIDDYYGRLDGGLNAGDIYISDLAGNWVDLDSMGDVVDAITVPEPLSLALLALGGLAMIRRHRA
jgi:hypothetical protein